jgi:hypothetical protein
MNQPPYWPPPPDWRPSPDRDEHPGSPASQPPVQTPISRPLPTTLLVAVAGALGAMVFAWVLVRSGSCGANSSLWVGIALWGVSVALAIGTAFWLTFRASVVGTVGRVLAGAAVGIGAGAAWGIVGSIVGLVAVYSHTCNG